jgi:hypothetical protein
MNMDWVYQIVNKKGVVLTETTDFYVARSLYEMHKKEGFYVKPVRK